MSNRKPPSHYDQHKPSEKAAVINVTNDLLKETMRILKKEDLFPKRARWIWCYDIKDIVQQEHTCVMVANGIEADTVELARERLKEQGKALARLYALDAKMSQAMLCEIEGDKRNQFESWAALLNQAKRVTRAWRTADMKKYTQRFGGASADESRDSAL